VTRPKNVPRWVELSVGAMLCVAGITMAVVLFTLMSRSEFDGLSPLTPKEVRQVKARLAEIRLAQLPPAVERPGNPRAECWGPRDHFARAMTCSGKRHEDAWLIYSPRD
jgi:hypothetical protein